MSCINGAARLLISTHTGRVSAASRFADDMKADPTICGPRRNRANATGAASRTGWDSTVTGQLARHSART